MIRIFLFYYNVNHHNNIQGGPNEEAKTKNHH